MRSPESGPAVRRGAAAGRRRRGPALLLLALAAAPAGAVITRLYPLADVIADADSILVLRTADRGKDGGAVPAERAQVLKGPPGPTRVLLRLSGAGDPAQVALLRRRLAAGRSVVLFARGGKSALGFVEGTWFRLAGIAGQESAWQLVHLEPYLRRTYAGGSDALRRLVAGVLAGRVRAPPPDAAVRPGYGPEPAQRKRSGSRALEGAAGTYDAWVPEQRGPSGAGPGGGALHAGAAGWTSASEHWKSD